MIKLLIFGANKNCIDKAISVLKFDKVEIVNFIDNDINKWNKNILEINKLNDIDKYSNLENVFVISPNDIKNYSFDYILICSAFVKEIYDQLVKLNLEEYKILVVPFIGMNKKDSEWYSLDKIYNLKNDNIYNQVFNKNTIDFINSRIEDLKFLKKSLDKNNEYFVFDDIRIPYEAYKVNPNDFTMEFNDIIKPNIKFNNPPVYQEGPYEYENVKIESNDIVIDGGANFGLFSCIAAKKAFNGVVYAFEPVPCIADTLSKTVREYKNVFIEKFGLSDKSEATEIDISMIENNSGGASLVRNKSVYTQKKTININTITIDEFIKLNNLKSVDFIKADIEGSERFMIEGAKETLVKYSPKLAIRTYHFLDDLEVIRELILKYNPNYILESKWLTLYGYVVK